MGNTEFRARFEALVKRSISFEKLDTEEATKTTLILPLLSALGYDIFNPEEIVPEYNADIGTKKGEKVDYAILGSKGEILFIIEAKKHGLKLGKNQISQLYRYFSVSETRLAVLSNGLEYWFFSDLDEDNKMDLTPFLKLNIQKITDEALMFLELLIKDQFHLKTIIQSAEDIRTKELVVEIINREFNKPSKEFVKFMFKSIFENKKFTSKAYRRFNPLLIEGIQKRERREVEVEQGFEIQEQSVQEDEIKPSKEEQDIIKKAKMLISMAEYYIGEVITLYRVTAHLDEENKITIIVDENPEKMICAFHVADEMHIGLRIDTGWQWMPLESYDSMEQYADYILAQASILSKF